MLRSAWTNILLRKCSSNNQHRDPCNSAWNRSRCGYISCQIWYLTTASKWVRTDWIIFCLYCARPFQATYRPTQRALPPPPSNRAKTDRICYKTFTFECALHHESFNAMKYSCTNFVLFCCVESSERGSRVRSLPAPTGAAAAFQETTTYSQRRSSRAQELLIAMPLGNSTQSHRKAQRFGPLSLSCKKARLNTSLQNGWQARLRDSRKFSPK